MYQDRRLAAEKVATTSQASETKTVTDTRRKKSRTETGLRFGPDVPVKFIRSELPQN